MVLAAEIVEAVWLAVFFLIFPAGWLSIAFAIGTGLYYGDRYPGEAWPDRGPTRLYTRWSRAIQWTQYVTFSGDRRHPDDRELTRRCRRARRFYNLSLIGFFLILHLGVILLALRSIAGLDPLESRLL